MTILSLTAVARVAARHVSNHGPIAVTDVLELLATITATTDRAEAGIRYAIARGWLTLDRDATLRIPARSEEAA